MTVNRVYKLVLFLSITIQLSLFFMVVTVSLWIDQLMNSLIGDLADFQTLYKVTSFITLAVRNINFTEQLTLISLSLLAVSPMVDDCESGELSHIYAISNMN